MRVSIKNRNKRALIEGVIVILIIAGLFFALKLNSGRILNEFKFVIIKSLQEKLHAQVEIGNIEGGILTNIQLRDIKLKRLGSNAVRPTLNIDKVILSYGLLDIFMSKIAGLNNVYQRFVKNQNEFRIFIDDGSVSFENTSIITGLKGPIFIRENQIETKGLIGRLFGFPVAVNGSVHNSYTDPTLYVNFNLGDRCWFLVNNKLSSPAIKGALILPGNKHMDISGNVRFDTDGIAQIEELIFNKVLVRGEVNIFKSLLELTVSLPRQGTDTAQRLLPDNFNTIKASLDLSDSSNLSVKVKFNHVMISGTDISTELYLKCKQAVSNKKELLMGAISSRGSIINYKPFQELDGVFLVRERTFFIKSFKLGTNYALDGKVDLNSPFDSNFVLFVKDADLRQLMVFASDDDPKNSISGIVNGKINLNGPFLNPKINGFLDAANGNLGAFKYDTINMELRGLDGVVDLKDAHVYKDAKSMVLEGQVNLKKLCLSKPFTVKTDQENIIWEGWNISKKANSTELTAGRNFGDEFRINFKTFKENAAIYGESQQKNEVNIKYKIRGNQNIKVGVKDNNESFMGLENEWKF